MKLLYCLLLLLVFIAAYQKVHEGFTTYQIDYGTGIGPWWAQGAGLGRGFHRCICSSSGDCRCINDNQFQNTSVYPQYYFN
jgi:hypothetical protein